MRCKGKVKIKGPDGRKRTKLCNTKLDDKAIFCPICGEPTQALKNELSAKRNWKKSWEAVKANLSKYLPFSIFIIFSALLINIVAFILTRENYWHLNLTMLFTVPLLLIPLSISDYEFTIRNYINNLKLYPLYLVFVLLNIVYFFLLKVICTGFLLNISIDAVLHIVRLIMVLYWLAIILPTPVAMAHKKLNVFKALRLSYIASAETRWQQFFLEIFIIGGIAIGAALAGLGLLVAIPLMYHAIIHYYHSLDDFDLFEAKTKKN
ncbi:MAG: hypothetical protein SVM86_05710 [Candidatus Cloacimonadota bacterium]|nr:hypothetical protein [Candidatus Cloacimonadota bacterium]